MNKLIERLSNYGLVPVIQIENVENAVPLAKALCAGGLEVAEVTFRTPCAAKAIQLMKEACPNMLIGAGTVLTKQQVDDAMEAGSEFIVSPGFNPTIVKYCFDKNIPIVPGTSSPSDMEQAIEMGLDFVKFFPAEASGGLNAIKAMSAPYGMLRFMPTGGINPTILNTYLSFNKIVACGGSWMVSADLLEKKDFKTIETLTREAVDQMLDIQLDHVELAMNNELDAKLSKNILDAILNDQVIIGNDKVSKTTLVFTTPNVERLVYFLAKRGISFDDDSRIINNVGKVVSIDLMTETNYQYRFIAKGE